MAISFTFKLPEKITHVFGISPDIYNYFGLPDQIYEGVERYPKWLCDELKYWNGLRGRYINGNGFSPSEEESLDEESNLFDVEDEEMENFLKRRYEAGGLEFPGVKDNTFGLAYPELPSEEESSEDEEDEDDIGFDEDKLDFIDATSTVFLGNLADRIKDLSPDDEIAILIRFKNNNDYYVFIDGSEAPKFDNNNLLILAEKQKNKKMYPESPNNHALDKTMIGNTDYIVKGENIKDVVVEAGKELETQLSEETVNLYVNNFDKDGKYTDMTEREIQVNYGKAAFMIMSVKDILNSPSKGTKVLMNLFNGGDADDNYGYYY